MSHHAGKVLFYGGENVDELQAIFAETTRHMQIRGQSVVWVRTQAQNHTEFDVHLVDNMLAMG